MSAIFLSHSGADNQAAGSVRAALEQLGHVPVFLDFGPERGIPPGRDRERELYDQLRTCRAMIVLCSAHSMASPLCFAEITHAHALGKAPFPLKVALRDVHPRLGSVQVIDLTAEIDADGFVRLGRGLRAAGLDPADSFDWNGTCAPYPGLLAFDEKDAVVFFGSDREIRDALSRRLQCLAFVEAAIHVLGASTQDGRGLGRELRLVANRLDATVLLCVDQLEDRPPCADLPVPEPS